MEVHRKFPDGTWVFFSITRSAQIRSGRLPRRRVERSDTRFRRGHYKVLALAASRATENGVGGARRSDTLCARRDASHAGGQPALDNFCRTRARLPTNSAHMLRIHQKKMSPKGEFQCDKLLQDR